MAETGKPKAPHEDEVVVLFRMAVEMALSVGVSPEMLHDLVQGQSAQARRVLAEILQSTSDGTTLQCLSNN
jgi:hypothetical protein